MCSRDKPINVLYCEGNTDGSVGGSFFSLLYLVDGLDRSRFNPIVVFHQHNTLISLYEKSGIQTIVLPKPTPLVFRKNDGWLPPFLFPMLQLIQKGLNFAGFLFSAFHYAQFLKQHEVGLLHLNNSIVRNHGWMVGAAIARIKCITHERGINQHYSKMSRFFAKKLDAVICISDAVRENMIEKGIMPNNLITIHNGIDPEVVAPAMTKKDICLRHGIKADNFPIGVIGNIKEWKGQETIIEALPAIIARFPNVVCLLVGDTADADRYYRKRLEKRITDLEISEYVIFTGYTRNVADYLSLLQIVIHTSREPEPFGRVLIEAMSLKKPVIGAHAGAIPEIIEDGKTGLTFPPGDADALADTVLTLMTDPDWAQKMGRAGYLRLCKKFLISTNVEKTERLYETVLKQTPKVLEQDD